MEETVIYLLDTNTFSYIASGRSHAAREQFRRLAKNPDSQLCISVMTEAEIRYGMNKRALSPLRRNAIEGLLANFQVQTWGSQEAAIYAKVLPALQARGIRISLIDLIIGVQAAARGAVLVTHDENLLHVAHVTGMKAADWAKDI